MFVQNATMDFILNGQAHGEIANNIQGVGYDTGLMRPFIDDHGRHCVMVNSGQRDSDGKPVLKKALISTVVNNGLTVNGPTSLRKDEWLQMDRAVVKAARQRLSAWSDLASASSFGGFDGMSKMILEHETMSDPGEALVDMDGIVDGRADEPRFQLEGLPLPITHSRFWFSQRRIAVSRNSGTPLDMTMGEAAARRVAEQVEKTLIGSVAGLQYGVVADYGNAPKVYGYTNHPDRITKTDVTTPTGSNGEATVADVLAMIESANDAGFDGPFMLYHSRDWNKFMDDDYRANDDRTLRQRLRDISDITDVRKLSFLEDTHTLLLVQMTSEVARAVTGMGLTTVQWESKGGSQVNFKVMAIMVPQLRSDYNGNMGLVHGTTS